MAVLGTIGYVDLNKRATRVEAVPDEWRDRFLGGRGLNTYLFLRHLKKRAFPLSPGNIIVLGSGILSGLGAGPLECAEFSTRFPLTGRFATAVLPGGFSAGMRRAGVDHIVLAGKSKNLIRILVEDQTIRLESARDLKGKPAVESLERIDQENRSHALRGLGIGPEGENRLPNAPACTHDGYIFGAMGAGAALGAKNVKAVVCSGTRDLPVKHPEALLDLLKEVLDAQTGLFSLSQRKNLPVEATRQKKKTAADPDIKGCRRKKSDYFEKQGMTLFPNTVFECLAHCLGLGLLRVPDQEFETAGLPVLQNLLQYACGFSPGKGRLVDTAFRVHAMERLLMIKDQNAFSGEKPFASRTTIRKERGWDKRSLKKLKVFKAFGIDDLWPLIREQEKREDE